MAPLDLDDPWYAIFHCDFSLDCDTHIELEIYTSKIQPQRIDICCHYVGANESPATTKASLNDPKGPYSIVLPKCEDCITMGWHIIVRVAGENAQAEQSKLDAHVAREARR